MRSFNRFYTRQLGLLHRSLLESSFNLTEARVLYELAHHPRTTAASIGAEMGLDPGYLSRILRRFEASGLLHRRSAWQMAEMLHGITPERQTMLLQGVRAVQQALQPAAPAPITLRPPRPGDFGWVIERHGAVYAQEYGWDMTFECFVAGIVADFGREWNRERENCWIAERAGERVGCVFLVKHPKRKRTAKLRMLLVERPARGSGLGKALVQECIRFARQAGYQDLMLWTNDILTAARKIYESEGFKLIEEEPHESFGKSLVGQTWELRL